MRLSARSTTAPAPDVSVIIPTYNRIAMLKEALASVLEQTFGGTVEIIVVDDNSQDGTPSIIREQYPDIYLIACSKNGGPSAARNKGICAAQGRYIAFLDSDDLWEADYLKTQVDTLNNQVSPEPTHFSVSDVWLWETDRNVRLHRPQGKHPDYTSLLHHLLAAGSFIHTPSAVVVHRQAFDQVGLFNESLRFAEDTDLYIRLLMAGYQPVFTRKTLTIRRKHSQGQAIEPKNIDLRIQSRIGTLKKYYPLIANGEIEPSLKDISAQIYAQFATQCYRSQHFLKWIALLMASRQYASWQTVMLRVRHDFGFTARKISGFLQKWRTTETV
ncbi:MAG: glycosyltransferase [Cyanobacteria bacterium P01_H01_bin.26]